MHSLYISLNAFWAFSLPVHDVDRTSNLYHNFLRSLCSFSRIALALFMLMFHFYSSWKQKNWHFQGAYNRTIMWNLIKTVITIFEALQSNVEIILVNIYVLKVNNGNTLKRCEIWLFKVNNKNTRTTSLTSFWSFYC